MNEYREQNLKDARKLLFKLGKDPDRLESFVDLIRLDTDKKSLGAVLTMLVPPVPEELLGHLVPLLAHADAGIRDTVFNWVAVTLKEQGTDFYVRALEEPKFRDKSQPAYRIQRWGNETAVPAMAKRLRQILNTRKASPHHYHNGETELTRCLDFLHRHQHCKQVPPVLRRMVEKWEILSDEEVYWITDQLEFFDHIDLRRGNHCLPVVVKLLDSDHPVFQACEEGDVPALRSFLESGISVYSNDTNRSLAGLAVRTGNLEVLKLLVEFGLNIERRFTDSICSQSSGL